MATAVLLLTVIAPTAEAVGASCGVCRPPAPLDSWHPKVPASMSCFTCHNPPKPAVVTPPTRLNPPSSHRNTHVRLVRPPKGV